MQNDESVQIAEILQRLRSNDAGQAGHLTTEVYEQLRGMADAHLRRRFGGASDQLTLQATSLVNEALLRVIKYPQNYGSNGEFFALLNTIMKRVILDYLRSRRAAKRGGGNLKVQFDENLHGAPPDEHDEGLDVEALFMAIDRLALIDQRKSDVAHMRLIWCMQIEEIAAALNISRATTERDWKFARAWLSRELEGR